MQISKQKPEAVSLYGIPQYFYVIDLDLDTSLGRAVMAPGLCSWKEIH